MSDTVEIELDRVHLTALTREANEHTPKLLPLMDDEVRRLGRSTSVRNVAMKDQAVEP